MTADLRAPDAVSDQPRGPHRTWPYVAGSVLVVLAMAVSGLWGTDDAFPLAPYRMFSYGNPSDGVVRVLRLEADLESGRHIRFSAEEIGLRRAELEGQTRFGRRVLDHKMAALARVYNERHDDDALRLQVVQRGVRLRNGKPQPGEELLVLGEWVDPRWHGPRTPIELPLAEDDLPGYRR